MSELGPFANKIFQRTYAINPDETWDNCAKRVANFVAGEHTELAKQFYKIIRERKFIPGGRYLAQAGKEVAQLTNCFLHDVDDSREGWSKLLYKHMMALSTGGGCGTYYGNIRAKGTPIKRFGGTASGPISLMYMVNEVARHVLAGGKRRSALWAGLPWDHPDVEEFIETKNWTTSIRALKELDFNFPAPLDMTNISVCLDNKFFNKVNKDKSVWDLYYKICKNMCKTGEPGFSINVNKNAKFVLRNPCQPGFATVLTLDGIRTFDDIEEGSIIWSGDDWVRVLRKSYSGIKPVFQYDTTASSFIGTKEHIVFQRENKVQVDKAKALDILRGPGYPSMKLNPQDIMDGLVIGDGGVHKASNNLVILYIGQNDTDYFNSTISKLIKKYRPGISSETYEIETTIKPEELSHTYNREIPERFYFGNTSTKLGFLRGLFSANGTIVGKDQKNRISLKQTNYNLILQVRDMLSSVGIKSYITTNKSTEIKHKNGSYTSKISYNLNISSDREIFNRLIGFIQKYKNDKIIPKIKTNRIKNKKTFNIKNKKYLGDFPVYNITVNGSSHSYWTSGSLVSNCGEVTSDTDSDCCNIGSINLSRIADIEELKQITRLAVKFLYLGTYRGWLPHEDFIRVRESSRRIGLGLMGLHEWCIRHGERYEPNGELGRWLSCWANISDDEADKMAKQMLDVRPVAVRAIAPTGTIGIIGETTTGIEPVYCVAYKLRYLGNNGQWQSEYIIDPTVKKLLEEGIISDPNEIEDSIKLSTKVERRIQMQAFVQSFVDQGISSTINLPEWGEPGNNNATQFAKTLLEYLPKLRGITVYPDGARPGQPIVPVKWETAMKYQPEAKEDEERCAGGVCGL